MKVRRFPGIVLAGLLLVQTAVWGLCLRGHDYLQDWMQLRVDNTFRITEDGMEGIKGADAILIFGPWKAVPYLCDVIEKMASSRYWDQGRAVLVLRDLEDERSIPTLMKAAMENDPAEAARLLGQLRAEKAADILVKLLYNEDYNVAAKALEGLRLLNSARPVPAMLTYGEKMLPRVKAPDYKAGILLHDLCVTFGWIGDKKAVTFLRKVLKYRFPFDDPTMTIQKGAAEALAMLGDTRSTADIVGLEREYEACRILKHPVALERAGEILTGSRVVMLEGMAVDMRGALIVCALRIFAEMGTGKDAAFLKERMQNMAQLGIETITGGEPPFGYGNYLVNNQTIPVLFAWALAGMGDKEGFRQLDRHLASEDIVTAAEAARAFVRLRQTDRYAEIASVFRKEAARFSYSGDEFEARYGIYDYSFRARSDIARMLGEQQSGAGLMLLVEMLNDVNINVVRAVRRGIRRYPAAQVVDQLAVQFGRAGEQELWQVATMLEMMGEPGMKVLYGMATGYADFLKRGVAMRAVIRAEYKDWRKLITFAVQQNNPSMRELIEWVNYRFEWAEPDIVDKCTPAGFQFSTDDIPREITEAPEKFFRALKAGEYDKAWELWSDDSRMYLVEVAGEHYFDTDYYTVYQAFVNNDDDVTEVWQDFTAGAVNPGMWTKQKFKFKKYLSGDKAVVTAEPSGRELIVVQEEGEWRFGYIETFGDELENES